MIKKLNKDKNINDAKNDTKKDLRLTRLERLDKQLKLNILKRKKATNQNG